MDPRVKRLYWQVTALLLAAHYAGWAGGLPLAIALMAGQVLHFGAFRRTLRALVVLRPWNRGVPLSARIAAARASLVRSASSTLSLEQRRRRREGIALP